MYVNVVPQVENGQTFLKSCCHAPSAVCHSCCNSKDILLGAGMHFCAVVSVLLFLLYARQAILTQRICTVRAPTYLFTNAFAALRYQICILSDHRDGRGLYHVFVFHLIEWYFYLHGVSLYRTEYIPES